MCFKKYQRLEEVPPTQQSTNIHENKNNEVVNSNDINENNNNNNINNN